jgi:ceramide glucosyltransferase
MPYVLLVFAAFGLLTSSVFAAIVLMAVPGYMRERRLAMAKAQTDAQAGFTPPLSLLKPLHGDEPGLESYLESFFTQDYPAYEILFCTRDASDPALAVARRISNRYPHISTKFLVTNGQPNYINAKVASLETMEHLASHEILVISDSDVRVGPDYLRSIALPFADPKVGGMCCLYRGVAAQGGLWARLEAIGMSVEMTSGVLAARMMEGMRFTLGPTMAFRRETIQRMGGFGVTADFCADDFILGSETHKLGQKVVLSHYVIDHMVINAKLFDSLKHQIRWMKSTRFSRPKGHFGTVLTFAMPFALLGLAAGFWAHRPLWGIGLFAVGLASRLALSFAVGRNVVGDTSWFGLLVLYPIRDLMGAIFWALSYFNSRILWRGQIFQLLPGGKMRAA